MVEKYKDPLSKAYGRLRQFTRYAVGRVLGTTPHTRGDYKQLQGLDEARHIHRTEITALSALLIEKGVFTRAELEAQTLEEAIELEKMLKKQFPEVTPADGGDSFKLDAQQFALRVKNERWPK